MKVSGPPPTILFFDHTAALSGGEIALLHLVERLDRTRYWPIVLLSSHGPLESKLSEAGIETHVLPLADSIVYTKRDELSRHALLRLRDSLRLIGYCGQVARFARARGVHLIHTNSLKADLIGGMAGRLAGVPVVWHVRDRIADDYLPPKVARAFRRLSRVLPRYVIANSAATWKTLHLPASRGCVVHDGVVIPQDVSGTATSASVSLAKTPEAELSTPEAAAAGHQSASSSSPSPRLVGIVGRLSPWKGQHIFIEAAHQVHQHFPEVQFQIIGSAIFGEEAYADQLATLIRRLRLEGVVRLQGFQTNVPEVIQGLEILVHASTSGEPFGQVVVEGMLEGRPVIATNGGGIPEIITHGATGLLVPMGDSIAMAQAIVQLLADPEHGRALGAAGQQHAIRNFDVRLTARKVEQVYERLLG